MIDLDVADFTPSELRVEIDGTSLAVVGSRSAVGPFALEGHLDESLRLPPGVAPERACARYAGGTLEIHIPKRPGTRRVVPIDRGRLVHADATPC